MNTETMYKAVCLNDQRVKHDAAVRSYYLIYDRINDIENSKDYNNFIFNGRSYTKEFANPILKTFIDYHKGELRKSQDELDKL